MKHMNFRTELKSLAFIEGTSGKAENILNRWSQPPFSYSVSDLRYARVQLPDGTSYESPALILEGREEVLAITHHNAMNRLDRVEILGNTPIRNLKSNELHPQNQSAR